MKKGWETKTLGEIADVQSGGTPLVSNKAFWNGNLPWYSSGELNDLYTSPPERHVSLLGIESSNAKLFPEGSLLIGMYDTAALKMSILDRAGAFNQAIAGVRPNERIDLVFVLHAINAIRESVLGQRRGVRQKNLSLGKIREIPIPVPPLAEQQRIVGLLDEALDGLGTAKANAEKNLQNARALFESHLQSVFTQRGKGWVENKLKSITTKIGSGATPRGGGESYKDEGISLIRSLNVHDLGFKYAKLAFLDDAQADELSNVEVQRRDVLLNITGASVARCAIVPDDVLPARVNQHVSIIRPVAEKLDADFLHYLLISRPYKDQLLKTGEEGGSTRQAITKAQIQDFTVEYPAKLKDQKIIVVKLDAMLTETQRLARIYERKLAALAELKKSLLHQAFTGEL